MNASDIQKIIESEINGDWTISNSHGVDLRRCLVTPRKVSCINTFPKLNSGKNLEMWIVLEETPGDRGGYLIVFDENTSKFGLADWGTRGPIFLGFHGTLLNTLEGM